MNICVVGTGYIGLPTAAILANNGHMVFGIDTDEVYIQSLKDKTYITREKGLDDLVYRGMDRGMLSFHTRVQKSDVFFICIGTPVDNEGNADLSNLIMGLDSILRVVEKGNLLIIESTIPPNTIRDIISPRITHRGFEIGKDIFLAYCPERVIPNDIINELINNPRIIGGYTLMCGIKAYEIYKSFVLGEIYIDSYDVAEMVKLVENSYRYVNIAYVNELALLCESLGINPYRVIELASKHPRVKLLNPGIGVGGHCLPVDSQFLVQTSKDYSKLIQVSSIINDRLPELISKKILELVQNIKNPRIALWGISYKENSSDIRNSPAIKISQFLIKESIEVEVFDPVVYGHDLSYGIKTLTHADLLVILVKHDYFLNLPLGLLTDYMDRKIIFDACNAIDINDNFKDIEIIKLYR